MGKAIIILTIVIALGLLANMHWSRLVGVSRSDIGGQEFQSGSQKYAAAYAAAGRDYRSIKTDVNHANFTQLTEVNGIGPVLAKKIIDYRQKNGYFKTLSELQNISGIGPKLIRRWESIIEISIDDTINQGGRIIE